MIIFLKFGFSLLALIGLVSCASGPSMREKALSAFTAGDLAGTEKDLISKDIISEEKSRLLTLLELGTVAHAAGEFEKSNIFFSKAEQMANQLYTASISDKAMTGLMNDNSRAYSGFDYEISMIHYYLVMNHLLIGQSANIKPWEMSEITDGKRVVFSAVKNPGKKLSPSEVSASYVRARAQVLAWDSFLETVRTKNSGKPSYKDDIVAKLLGAYVHRIIGTREDRSTAKILYGDAKNVLLKNYSLFPTFNSNNEKFKSGYRGLSSESIESLKSTYVVPTQHYNELEQLIQLSSDKITSDNTNTLVVLETGMIPDKRERIFTIGLSTLINSIEDKETRQLVDAIGMRLLLQFAPKVGIGLVSVAAIGAATSNKNQQPDTFAGAVDKAIGFEFKLPEIRSIPTDIAYKVILKSSDGKLVEVPLAVVNPISDFASFEVEQKSAAVATKTGIRVGIKYLVALAVAYKAYTSSISAGEFIASTVGSAAWIVAKKAVDATEAADIRSWNFLPQTVSMMETQVAPGSYEARAIGTRGTESWSFDLGKVEITKDIKNIVKRRLFLSQSGKGATQNTNVTSTKYKTDQVIKPVAEVKKAAKSSQLFSRKPVRNLATQPAEVSSRTQGPYTVQVAANRNKKGADAIVGKLKEAGVRAYTFSAIVNGENWYRVSIGFFSTFKEANLYMKELLRSAKISAAFVRKVSSAEQKTS